MRRDEFGDCMHVLLGSWPYSLAFHGLALGNCAAGVPPHLLQPFRDCPVRVPSHMLQPPGNCTAGVPSHLLRG